MNINVRFLCDREGQKRVAQLPHDEYMRLIDSGQEAILLRAKLKHAEALLGSYSFSENVPVERKTAVVMQKAVLEAEVQKPEVKAVVEPVKNSPVQNGFTSEAPAASAEKRAVSSGEEQAVPLSPMLQSFLMTTDPSQKSHRLIETCARKLSGLCGKRITLSLHKPYICFWDYDEWKTFAFGEIIDGVFYLSVEKALMPDSDSADIWIPPSGLCKKPLVRLKVEAVTDGLLAQLKNTIAHKAEPAVGAA